MRTRLSICLIATSLILVACGGTSTTVPTHTPAPPTHTPVPPASPTVPPPTDTPEPEPVEVAGPIAADGRYSAAAGQALYFQHCAVCHGDEGRGDGPTAGALDPGPADFTDRELRNSRTPADRLEIITNGVAGTGMPPWGAVLSDEERRAVLYYEWSLATSPEGVAAGQQVFETNCVVCHGEGGQGDGPTADSLDTRPANFSDHEFMASRSDQDLFETITGGRAPMPAWGEVLSEDRRWQVIAYLRTFTYQPAGPGSVVAEPTARPEGEPPGFQQDVLPILVANCVRCHSGDSPPNGLRLTDYQTVMKGSLYLPVVRPGDPESSPIYLMTSKGTMPANGQPLNQAEVQTLYDWIAAGAPDN